MSPDPPHVDETERVQGPLTLSETCTWPDAPNWPNHPTSRSPAETGWVRVRVYDVEGVDRIGVVGRRRDVRVEEDRGVGPRRADGGTVSVHGIAGDAAARRRPREGDPRGGHAGGLEADGRGGDSWRRGGSGMEDGAHRDPVGGGA